MSALMGVLAQATTEPDPSIVTPGMLGLGLTLALGIALLLLFRSLKRQLNRIDIPEQTKDTDGENEQPPAE